MAVHAIKWLGHYQYMQVEALAQNDAAQTDPLLGMATQAARLMLSAHHPRFSTTLTDVTTTDP